MGLVGGIELVADKKNKRGFDAKSGVGLRAFAFAQEEGVISRALGSDTLSICPPLVISESDIDEMFARLARGLDRTHAWASGEGLMAS
jgi:4-aminobutyrate--pyruvate transaminase